MSEGVREDIKQINIKLAALEIIISAPLWPRRDDLRESGRRIHDAMIEGAKPYALAIAEMRYEEAFSLADGWSALAIEFMDSTRINADDPLEREANNRMIAVYKHYLNATGVDWSKLEVRDRSHAEAVA